MELTETIESLNNQLIDLFGIDSITGLSIWRIVWANDQREKRRMNVTPAGIELLYPQVFEVQKYPYIRNRYVLERLVIVPEMNQDEIPGAKLSYEPMWTYENAAKQHVPPTLPATKFIIDGVYAAIGKASMARYIENEEETSPEGREERVKDLENQLFGDESGLFGKTFSGEGIIVPDMEKKKDD